MYKKKIFTGLCTENRRYRKEGNPLLHCSLCQKLLAPKGHSHLIWTCVMELHTVQTKYCQSDKRKITQKSRIIQTSLILLFYSSYEIWSGNSITQTSISHLRPYFFFSPPAHLCAVTYMTEISLIVTLNKQFNSTQLNIVCWMWMNCGK